jgi:hypothetical protein
MVKRMLVNARSKAFHLIRACLEFIVVSSNIVATAALLEIFVQSRAGSFAAEPVMLLTGMTTRRHVRAYF